MESNWNQSQQGFTFAPKLNCNCLLFQMICFNSFAIVHLFTDLPAGFMNGKRTSGESSTRENSNASSNGGSSNGGTSNGESSMGGKTGLFKRSFHIWEMCMLKPTFARHRTLKSPMVCL